MPKAPAGKVRTYRRKKRAIQSNDVENSKRKSEENVEYRTRKKANEESITDHTLLRPVRIYEEFGDKDATLIDLISNGKRLSMFSFDCRCLCTHFGDLRDSEARKAMILLLSDTRLENEEEMTIPNFDPVVLYKRPHIRPGGVAIYHNTSDTSNIVAANMDLNIRQINLLGTNNAAIGEMCAARCVLEGELSVLTIVTYIVPDQPINQVIQFIHNVLFAYTDEGAVRLGRPLDDIPMVLTGDFNINFGSKEAQELIAFLDTTFNLKMHKPHSLSVSTTKSGTTIGAIFSRYLDQQTKLLASYYRF